MENEITKEERKLEDYSEEELLLYMRPVDLQFIGARLSTASDADAARIIDRSPRTVWNWANESVEGLPYNRKQIITELVKRFGRQYVKVAQERMLKLTNEAVDILEDTMKGDIQAQLQFQAAKEILDRTGVTAKQQVEITGDTLVDNRQIIIHTIRELLPPVDIIDGEIVDKNE